MFFIRTRPDLPGLLRKPDNNGLTRWVNFFEELLGSGCGDLFVGCSSSNVQYSIVSVSVDTSIKTSEQVQTKVR